MIYYETFKKVMQRTKKEDLSIMCHRICYYCIFVIIYTIFLMKINLNLYMVWFAHMCDWLHQQLIIQIPTASYVLAGSNLPSCSPGAHFEPSTERSEEHALTVWRICGAIITHHLSLMTNLYCNVISYWTYYTPAVPRLFSIMVQHIARFLPI